MRATRIVLAALLVTDLALAAAVVHARSVYHFTRGPFRAGLSAIRLPAGFLADNTPYDRPADPHCALIQFTSNLCPDCDLNWIVASGLSRSLQSLGCSAVRLAPSPEQLPTRQMQLQEAEVGWIKPDWLEQLPRLEMEPTAIALGPGGKIVWYKVGELSPRDVQMATARVRDALH